MTPLDAGHFALCTPVFTPDLRRIPLGPGRWLQPLIKTPSRLLLYIKRDATELIFEEPLLL